MCVCFGERVTLCDGLLTPFLGLGGKLLGLMCHRPDLVNVPGTVEHSVTGKCILGCSAVVIAMEGC